MASEKAPDPCIHQKGMHDRSASADLPAPKGGSVNAEPTRSKPGEQPPTIGPRAA